MDWAVTGWVADYPGLAHVVIAPNIEAQIELTGLDMKLKPSPITKHIHLCVKYES